MTWELIYNNARMLYASEERDKRFRQLRLREQLYAVRYYVAHPLTELDYAIIETLLSNGSVLNDLEFARILGFNVIDDRENKRYNDPAEKDIFDKIIQEVAKFALISVNDHTIRLTPLGRRAIENDVKYEFRKGHKPLMEFFDIRSKADNGLMFPFYDALGLETPLRDAGSLDYDEFNDTEVLDNILSADNQLIQRFNLQSSVCPNIFDASIAYGDYEQEKRIRDIYVDFRIFLYEQEVYPMVFYLDRPCSELNELLWSGENRKLLSQKKLNGLYHYTVRNTKLPLNYENLAPYSDFWQIIELISSERFVWSDKQLFNAIQSQSTGNDWVQISKRCPLPELETYIPQYIEFWEWTVLSHRCEDRYVANNITSFPWDFSLLSTERSIDFLKPLIVKSELSDREWDWDAIVPQLDIPFIINNLSVLDIDLHTITEQVLESYPQSILQYPGKRWNWLYISQEAQLQFILSNIALIGENLTLEEVIDRAFSDEEFVSSFCQSADFAKLVSERLKDSSFCANQKEYCWTPTLINWLELHSLVHWLSTPNMIGLECNPFIIWDESMFEKYKSRNRSYEGWIAVSSRVVSTKIIRANMTLPWSWPTLSERDIVRDDYDFIAAAHYLLDMSLLLPAISSEFISRLYEDGVLEHYMQDDELRALITENASYNTITSHISDEWDWKVLTKRFCANLKIEFIGRPQWIDKWDWNYLSENFDLKIIESQLDLYIDRWNWTSITRRLEHDFILTNLSKFALYWDWSVLTSEVFNGEDLQEKSYLPLVAHCISKLDSEQQEEIWASVTSLIPIEAALAIITKPYNRSLYKFNLLNIYNRREFDIDSYLDACLDAKRVYIDWDALSRSKALNSILVWDKKVIKDFHIWADRVIEKLTVADYAWNFKYLSQLPSINWCDAILSVRTDEWDWDYLSEQSLVFHGPKNIVKHIQRFARYINFDILSQRTDLNIKEKDFEKLADLPWSWPFISKNTGVEISTLFITKHDSLNWDWYEVSARRDFYVAFDYIHARSDRNWNWAALSKNRKITFDIKLFLSLLDKEWDWEAISKRPDILFVEDVVKALANYPLDWEAISRRDDFEASEITISLLKDKGIDWSSISKRVDLSFEFIDKFKDYLDWHEITKTPSIDIANPKYLDAFYDYVDWKYISASPLFVVNKQNLENYKYYLDWRFISHRPELNIDLVDDFEDFIDWTYFSRATKIKLTPAIIEKYAERWDWVELSHNANFAEFGLDSYYASKLNLAKFYQHIKDVRKEPAIYHFTHMFNAVEIIRSRTILSRDKAIQLGQLKYDAAGKVVNRTAKAHKFVRFYFRTGTQTQFYNECLGRQVGAKYYSNAEKNGLPMCPMPVFFKFDLQEVLAAYGDDCFYSTGNMQSSSAVVRNVSEHPDGLTIDTLFSGGHSKEEQEKRQQEFLIPNEFDFSRLKNFQIICYNRTQREILEQLFEGDPICEHFTSVESEFTEDVFMKENPYLYFDKGEDSVSISTNYIGDYHFQIIGADLSSIHVINKQNTIRDNDNEICLRKNVNIEVNGGTFEIFYICDNPNARTSKWLIYKQ